MANRVLRFVIVLFLASILCLPAEATAAAISWNTTATSNDWAIATNWSPGTVPTNADDQTFTTSNYTAILKKDTNSK
ncbi:MAG: hypothetical protein U1E05_06455 [Patescibacteria group bacterium]|nr:hypothetical protein [Patescibacteria group bacterium]